MGPRQRLLPVPRRPRGARLLRLAEPDLHGRQVRRLAGGPAGSDRRAGHADHVDHPYIRAVGAGAHPGPRSRSQRGGAGRRCLLLTDDKPKLLAGGKGLSIDRSEGASAQLLGDLRSDKGMGWVPDSMWFSYLQGRRHRGRARLRPGHLARRQDASVHRAGRDQRSPGSADRALGWRRADVADRVGDGDRRSRRWWRFWSPDATATTPPRLRCRECRECRRAVRREAPQRRRARPVRHRVAHALRLRVGRRGCVAEQPGLSRWGRGW